MHIRIPTATRFRMSAYKYLRGFGVCVNLDVSMRSYYLAPQFLARFPLPMCAAHFSNSRKPGSISLFTHYSLPVANLPATQRPSLLTTPVLVPPPAPPGPLCKAPAPPCLKHQACHRRCKMLSFYIATPCTFLCFCFNCKSHLRHNTRSPEEGAYQRLTRP